MKICPTYYAIKTRTDMSNNVNPQNWCIEVSNTGKDNDWKNIDSQNGVKDLQEHHKSAIFKIKIQLDQNESYRYIRLRMTGKSTCGSNALTLNSLEYFGVLFPI